MRRDETGSWRWHQFLLLHSWRASHWLFLKVKPGLQMHLYEPSVFTQIESSSTMQSAMLSSHSLRSVFKNRFNLSIDSAKAEIESTNLHSWYRSPRSPFCMNSYRSRSCSCSRYWIDIRSTRLRHIRLCLSWLIWMNEWYLKWVGRLRVWGVRKGSQTVAFVVGIHSKAFHAFASEASWFVDASRVFWTLWRCGLYFTFVDIDAVESVTRVAFAAFAFITADGVEAHASIGRALCPAVDSGQSFTLVNNERFVSQALVYVCESQF